jgi:hypothetical protein
MTQTVEWPKPPVWGDEPPLTVGEGAAPSMEKGKNVGSTNKGKLKSTKPSGQSTKNTGLY